MYRRRRTTKPHANYTAQHSSALHTKDEAKAATSTRPMVGRAVGQLMGRIKADTDEVTEYPLLKDGCYAAQRDFG